MQIIRRIFAIKSEKISNKNLKTAQTVAISMLTNDKNSPYHELERQKTETIKEKTHRDNQGI